jgi:hypothetical protein
MQTKTSNYQPLWLISPPVPAEAATALALVLLLPLLPLTHNMSSPLQIISVCGQRVTDSRCSCCGWAARVPCGTPPACCRQQCCSLQVKQLQVDQAAHHFKQRFVQL